MKIEIKTTTLGFVAPDICIPVNEFFLAKKEIEEMRNLERLMDYYLGYYGIDYSVVIKEYNSIVDQIGNRKNGNLIFVIMCDDPRRYRPNYWFEIYLISGNDIISIDI